MPPSRAVLTLKPSGLALHILYHNVINFTERSTVAQNIPRLIGMIVNFNKCIVTYCKQAVPLKIGAEIVVYCILIQAFSVN